MKFLQLCNQTRFKTQILTKVKHVNVELLSVEIIISDPNNPKCVNYGPNSCKNVGSLSSLMQSK